MTIYRAKSCSELYEKPTNHISSTSEWLEDSERQYSLCIEEFKKISISENIEDEFETTKAFENLSRAKQLLPEMAEIRSTHRKIEALLLADSAQKRARPSELSKEGVLLHTIESNYQWINDLAEPVDQLLRSNHNFLRIYPELGQKTKRQVLKNTRKICTNLLSGKVTKPKKHQIQGAASKIFTQEIGTKEVIQKHVPLTFVHDCSNNAQEEARRAFLVKSQHVSRPLAMHSSCSAYYEFAKQGDFFEVLKRSPFIGYESIKKLLEDIAKAFEKIHEAGFVHRDLKLENILIFSDKEGRMTAKVTDFGFAKSLEELKKINFHLNGTYLYMAPELDPQIKQRTYDEKIDVWAYGILILSVLTGLKFLPRGIGNISLVLQQYGRKCKEQFGLSDKELTPLLKKKKIKLILKLFSYIEETLCDNQKVRDLVSERRSEVFLVHQSFERKDPKGHLFEIALKCLNKSPAERPSMTQIREELESLS